VPLCGGAIDYTVDAKWTFNMCIKPKTWNRRRVVLFGGLVTAVFAGVYFKEKITRITKSDTAGTHGASGQ
jgi:hypothetical protein